MNCSAVNNIRFADSISSMSSTDTHVATGNDTTTSHSTSIDDETIHSRPKKKTVNRKSVIVIGAGMSGLACARELQHRGYYVLVVEARRRVGGRLFGGSLNVPISSSRNNKDNNEDTPASYDIDLGGALIHGVVGNPVATLVQEIGQPVQSVEECLLLDSGGWPVDPKEDDRVSTLFNECLDVAFARAEQEGDSVRNKRSASFGDLFESVCKEKNVAPSNLLRWHQANLEVSCGASFGRLGYKWNDDEQYGFEGEHMAIQHSWRPIVEALAEGLDILYDAPVKHIQVVHPERLPEKPKTNKSSEQSKPQMASRPAQAVKNNDRNKQLPANPVSRVSHRIRGVEAGTRRSIRTKTPVDRLTIDPSNQPPQFSKSPSKSNDISASATSKGPKETMVRITLENDITLQAHAVVCTLPLGILKQKLSSSNSVPFFDPPLPVTKQHAIERLGSGLLNKCVLAFSHVFWQDSDFLGLASDDRAYLVLNGHKYTGQPVVIFMYGGDFAKEIQEWTDQEIVTDCLKRLKTICGSKKGAQLIDYRVTRWGKEQYSLMSFSYVPPGVDGLQEYQAMGQPILNRDGTTPVLLFAGEHTTAFHPSTIHGAYLSGIREAYRLDCALFPEENDFLEFQDNDIYERTFSLENDLPELNTDSDDNEDTQPVLPNGGKSYELHRRRGATRVKRGASQQNGHYENNPADSTQLMEATRRSQRGYTSPPPTMNVGEHNDSNASHEPAGLENEQIARAIESYGRDCEHLHSTILPVHNSNASWTLAEVKKRVHQVANTLRQRKPPTSSTWKRWIHGGSRNTSGKTNSHRSSGDVSSFRRRPTAKSAPSNGKINSRAEAVPPMRKAQLLTVTRSGRKVKSLFSSSKRPAGSSASSKTRSGRAVKKPRTA